MTDSSQPESAIWCQPGPRSGQAHSRRIRLPPAGIFAYLSTSKAHCAASGVSGRPEGCVAVLPVRPTVELLLHKLIEPLRRISDLMSTDPREQRLARRVADLYATDPQFADARPIEALTAAIEQPGLRLPRIMSTVMGAYAERPAVGERAVNLATDPETGRTSLELLPSFETVTYRELW